MTTTFWLTLAALIGLALVFILYPLFFHRPDKEAVNDIRHQNLLAYRSRLAELDAEREAANLDNETYQQMREELSGSLLDDVDRSTSSSGRHIARLSGRRWAVAVVLVSIIAVPAVSLWLYQGWGGVSQLEQYQTMLEMQQADASRGQQMAALAEQLRDRLEENPSENVDGWAMLGRTYMNLENYADAAWAFKQLAGQLDGNPDKAATAWGLSAQARFFQSQGAMNKPVRDAIAKAQALNPDEVNALGLLGITAFEQQDYQAAIEHWERIIDVAPQHPQLPSIREGVAEAYRRLGKPVPESLVAADVSVTVHVELADQFKDAVAPDTTLFVFARDAKGSRMPLAAARLTAGQLPVTLTLDDSMSMGAGARLSDASSVVVSARLSPAGQALPQSGDWQGSTSAPIELKDYDGKPVTVVINQQVP